MRIWFQFFKKTKKNSPSRDAPDSRSIIKTEYQISGYSLFAHTTDFEETHVYNFTLNSFVLHNKLLHDLVFQ